MKNDHFSLASNSSSVSDIFTCHTVSGLRKILKKHDKQVRDKLIATNYLSTRAQEKYSSMRQLYNNEGIMALVASLRK